MRTELNCILSPTGIQSHRPPVFMNSIPSVQLITVSSSPLIQKSAGTPGYGSYGHSAVNTIRSIQVILF